MLLLRTILFSLLAPLMVGFVYPYLVVWRFPRWLVDLGVFHWLGAPLIVVAAAIYIWCAADFYRAHGTPSPADPPKELVVRGPYRYVRNPMYVGVLTGIIGMAILLGSGLLLVYLVAAFAIVHTMVTLYEEPHLRKAFGAAYEDYYRRVPRWLPRF
jgi:protein-S-isoprenylcysteine O-methyltransferase Ste14